MVIVKMIINVMFFQLMVCFFDCVVIFNVIEGNYIEFFNVKFE